MSKTLHVDWSANFAMHGEHEKSRMKEAANELVSLISSLNLGSKEPPFEEYVQLVGEKIVDAEYNMAELLDLAWVEKSHLGAQPMDGNDVDGQPTPIVKASSSL